MWAVVDEVSTRRPWKDHQKEYYALLRERVTEQLDFAKANVDSTRLIELQAGLAAAEDSMAAPAYLRMHETYTVILEQLIEENREYQFAKSRGDEAYYFYKKSVKEGHPDEGEKEKLDENEAEMQRRLTAVRSLETRRDSLLKILNGYKEAVRVRQASMGEILATVEKWELKLSRLEESSIQIHQVMMLDYDRNPFNDPKARVDRCQSCHLGWAEEVMEGAPEPYTLHPLPDLLRFHNPEKFGCTPCHRGQGPALTAGFAHGDEDHYWENPILRGKDIWASCNECHENESSLNFAPEFTKAKQLMIENGCHGCHEIKGYTDLPKIGPDITRIAAKTTPSWIYSWIRNPKQYNPHTRMPDFKFSEEQAEAVTAFLVSLGEKDPFLPVTGSISGGDARRGKQLVESAGCLACHAVGDQTKVRDQRGTSYDIAPELTRIGAKVDGAWLFDWVRNPRHYNPTTRMPSLRLTDGEARDIVAYLVTLRSEWEPDERALDLTSPAVISRGEKLVREYGCTGCHVIKGMEKEGRVSVSLSNFGRKKVDEMDFGDTDVHHSWDDWIFNKLKNARVFATDRIEQKMPVFSFTEDEITSLRMFLRGQTKDEPDQKYVRTFDKRQQNAETGRRIALQYNCRQCHQLEGYGGYIGALLDDPAFMPPPITGEGKKVQEPWLHDFLIAPSVAGSPNSIRPWIRTRMPSFGFSEDEISRITKYFLALGNGELSLRDYSAFRPSPELLPIGRSIFDDFQCAKCHPTGGFVPSGDDVSTQDLAPDLTKARNRLKPEWIIEWIADPGRLQEGTRMPTFFPDGQSPLPEVLDGNAHRQIEALRDYVMSMGVPGRTGLARR
jgi:mono/diheme cytochrome c family protein